MKTKGVLGLLLTSLTMFLSLIRLMADPLVESSHSIHIDINGINFANKAETAPGNQTPSGRVESEFASPQKGAISKDHNSDDKPKASNSSFFEQLPDGTHNWTISFDGWKFVLTVFGLVLVMRQLLFNRRAAKDKIIYDLNKNLESYGKAVKFCEYYKNVLKGQSEPFELKTPSAILQGPENYGSGSLPSEDTFNILDKAVQRNVPKLSENDSTPSTYTCMRNMLRAFETIMLMLETKVIKDSEIFPLMGYRLSLLVNCPVVQCNLLFTKSDNYGIEPNYRFSAVFALYHRLMKYEMLLISRLPTSKMSPEKILGGLRIMEKFELSSINSWIYENQKLNNLKREDPALTPTDDGNNGKNSDPSKLFDADLWKPENEWQTQRKIRNSNAKSPFLLALCHYNNHQKLVKYLVREYIRVPFRTIKHKSLIVIFNR